MHNLDVAPVAKIQDVLSVPTQFSIAPSGSLPVAAFLQLASFESMTSREALHALRDVQKNDTVTWDRVKTAQYRVETPQADEEAEPPFAHAAGVELDASDVAVDAVLQHIALGELSIPDGYSADGLGNLLADNESESYEQAPDDTEPQFAAVTTDSSKEVDVEGRGKRRRVANTQYKDFWQH
ncbi:hypothetical protein EV424DRAFT_1455805 [Suillus variegatus]|nr:hypothetical protein EV424DRAFT_1455805 [Suillus variegatus]